MNKMRVSPSQLLVVLGTLGISPLSGCADHGPASPDGSGGDRQLQDSREITYPPGMPGWLDVTRSGSSVVGGACPDALPNRSDAASAAQTTAAIQCRLDAMGFSGNPTNLYFPPGTYYIASTLDLTNFTARNFTHHGDGSVTYPGDGRQTFHLLGRNPDTTSLVWAGSCDALPGLKNNSVKYPTLLHIDGSPFQIERMTFDGKGCAGVGLEMTSYSGIISPVTIREMVFENFSQVGVNGNHPPLSDADSNPCASMIAAGVPCTSTSGYRDFGMVSEVSILQSQFLNNGYAGVYIGAWNALDYWIQGDLFDGNGIAVSVSTASYGQVPALPWNDGTGGAGAFDVSACVVKNSRGADFAAINSGRFAIRGTYSVGGLGPFVAASGNSQEWFLQDNTVVSGPGVIPLIFPKNENVSLIQNHFFTQGNLPAVVMISDQPDSQGTSPLVSSLFDHVNADLTSIGNSYSSPYPFARTTDTTGPYTDSPSLVASAIDAGAIYQCSNGATTLADGRTACGPANEAPGTFNLVSLDDRSNVSPSTIPPVPPAPAIRAETDRHVIAVQLSTTDAAANVQALQAALNQLASQEAPCAAGDGRCAEAWGIVYLPEGHFPFDAVVQVPGSVHLQIVGTGLNSELAWHDSSTTTNVPILHLNSPAHVILRDFAITPVGAITADVVDQPGSRIIQEASQMWSRATVEVNGIGNAAFEARGVMFMAPGQRFVGNGSSSATGYYAIFGGFTSFMTVGAGMNLMVQDSWYEGGQSQFIECTDRATATVQTTHVSLRDPGHPIEDMGNPKTSFEWSNCAGPLTILASEVLRVHLEDGAPSYSVRLPASASPEATVAVIDATGNVNNYGSGREVIPASATNNPARLDQGYAAIDPATPATFGMAQNKFSLSFATSSGDATYDYAEATQAGNLDSSFLRQALAPTLDSKLRYSNAIPLITDLTKTDIQIYNVSTNEVWATGPSWSFAPAP